MASADLPPDVARFLTTYVVSATDLEVLLYLHAHPLAEWGVRAVAEVLDLDPAGAEAALSRLQQEGLLAMRESPSRLYQYCPRTPALAASVDRLATASAQRRFAVVARILSTRASRRRRLFLRFWWQTNDRLFLIFALAFGVEGINRIALASSATPSEGAPVFYLVRLGAFVLILCGVWDKNRSRSWALRSAA